MMKHKIDDWRWEGFEVVLLYKKKEVSRIIRDNIVAYYIDKLPCYDYREE